MVSITIPTGNRHPMTLPDTGLLSAVVVAGGTGRRFGGEIPKQFLELSGVPVLIHTLRKFEGSPVVRRIILVLPPARCRWFEENVLPDHSLSKLSDIVAGGNTRQDSVRHGLAFISADKEPYVAIHDGVRPFFDPRWLERGLEMLRAYPAVAVGIPPVDTIKRVSGRAFVVATPKRESLTMVQTPQMFQTRLIQEAHERAGEKGWKVSDDTALMEKMGHPVKILPGSRWNIKITEPADLELGEMLLHLSQDRGIHS